MCKRPCKLVWNHTVVDYQKECVAHSLKSPILGHGGPRSTGHIQEVCGGYQTMRAFGARRVNSFFVWENAKKYVQISMERMSRGAET